MTETLTPLETLTKARELLSDLNRWTKEVSARDVDDRPIGPCSPHATCWCILGALCHVNETNHYTGQAIVDLVEVVQDIAYFNDHAKHSQVLGAFDKAIQNRKAKGDAA